MGFDFGKVKDTKNIKTIDTAYQYIVDEFNNLTNIYHTNYKMIDTGNFDYSLTFMHKLSSDNNNNELYLGGTYKVNMKHLIDNEKYLYTIIPIQTKLMQHKKICLCLKKETLLLCINSTTMF